MRKFKKGMSVALSCALVLTLGLTQADEAAAAGKVKLSKKKVTITVGKSKKITLKNSKKKAKWSIKKGKKYIKLTKKKNKSVTIKAVKKGSATVVAKVGKKKYTCKVTVKAKSAAKTTATPTTAATATPKPATATATPTPASDVKAVAATSIKLNRTQIGLAVSDTAQLDSSKKQLTATVYPENTTDKTVTWKSSNASLVSVSSTGEISTTSTTAGTATITATTANGKSATCEVTVCPKVTAFEVNEKDTAYSVVKKASDYQPEVKDAYTITPEESVAAIDFISDDELIAGPSTENKLVGIGTGTTDVTIKLGSKSGKVTVQVSKNTVAIHDPSIFKDPKSGKYYTVGTGLGMAESVDLKEWTSTTQGVSLLKDGMTAVKTLTDYTGGSTIDDIWAADLIYIPETEKYVMYVCANGVTTDKNKNAYARVAIGALTSDKVTGPYEYAQTIVCSDWTTAEQMERSNIREALGLSETAEIPARYDVAQDAYDAIDPNPYWGHDGNLYLAWGSFTGNGVIAILKLDPKTGLRSPEYNYEYDAAKNQDPYFGKTVTKGYYGEGPYVLKVPNKESATGYYYYLYTSSGSLANSGSYIMKVARSENPDGPFTDYAGNDTFTSNGTLVQYNYRFSNQTQAFMSMGGNCAYYDEETGKCFIEYHNKFADGSASPGFHMLKVHQMFINDEGWPVVTPFEYNGETIADSYDKAQIVGEYEFVVHDNKTNRSISLNKASFSYKESRCLTLTEEGKVTGGLEGTWTVDGNKVTISAGDVTYKGVLLEQYQDDATNSGNVTSFDKTLVFTTQGSNSTVLWGAKVTKDGKEAAAYDLSLLELLSTANADFTLPTDGGTFGSTITWTSGNAKVIGIDGTTAKVVKQDSDKKITLTAVGQRDGKKATRAFSVSVPAYQPTIATQISESSTIDLPSKTPAGTTIVWKSSDNNVINPETGVVTAPESGYVKITLTATYGSVTQSYIVNVGEIQYIYDMDYDSVTDVANTWTTPNYQAGLSLVADEDNATNKYVQFASGSQNSRGAYTNFSISDKLESIYFVELDAKLTAGTNQETNFVIAGTDHSYTKSKPNDGTTGYILKLMGSATDETEDSTTWIVNDNQNQQVTITKNSWIHIRAIVNTSSKEAKIVITDSEGEEIFNSNVAVNGNGILDGLYIRDGRYKPVVCVDNIKVY